MLTSPVYLSVLEDATRLDKNLSVHEDASRQDMITGGVSVAV
jgi:hypothetical protein